MHNTSNQLSKAVTEEQKSLLKERLIGKKNLVYYASGRNISDAYSQLSYDNVVLVDTCFRNTLKIEGRVITIGLWSTFATALFKEIGVRFDAFITGNDGLSEGGGLFPLNSNHSLSNILPVLKDSYVHVAFPGQYRRKWKKMFLDMPLVSTLLSPKDSDYLDPKIFTSMDKPGKVWRVSKKAEAPATFKVGKRDIEVVRKNIWDDYNTLDALFVRVPPSEAKNLKSLYSKVECVKDYSFKQILEYCNVNKISKIGLCPFGGNYSAILDFMLANESAFPLPTSVHFHHLHKNDYSELYFKANQYDGHIKNVYINY